MKIFCESLFHSTIQPLSPLLKQPGKIEFMNQRTQPQHLTLPSSKTQFQAYQDQMNQAVYTTGQIILLNAFKRAMPKDQNIEVIGFRRPTYNYREAPAFSYDVLVKNGDFLKESCDASEAKKSKSPKAMKNILKQEQLQLLNVHAREIIQEKLNFECVDVPHLAGAREDVDEYLNCVSRRESKIENDQPTGIKLIKMGEGEDAHFEAILDPNESSDGSSITLPNTSFIKHFAFTNMTLLCNLDSDTSIYRLQGICCPELVDSEIFRILEQNAAKFVINDLMHSSDLAVDSVWTAGFSEERLKNDDVEFRTEADRPKTYSNKLKPVDFSPLYCSLETDLKYTNSKMQQSLLSWLTPYSNLKPKNSDEMDLDENLEKLFFEKENLLNTLPMSEKSVSQKQAQNHKFSEMYFNHDQHKHFLYQGDAVLHLGLKGEKFSENLETSAGVKRWEEWNQALHFICMIGGPIIKDCRWYRRKYLNPRAMGRWDQTF